MGRWCCRCGRMAASTWSSGERSARPRRFSRSTTGRCAWEKWGQVSPFPLNYSFAMAISKDLLEILVCPVCKATVELKPDGTGLKCVECHRVYPVRDDIPVMLVDEAKIEE